MEVVEGTEADRKGGHIARRRADGAARPARDGADPAGGRGVVPRLPSLALLQHQQPLGRPRGAGADARGDRRRARAAADRQPQDRRSARPELAAGAPARERDGRGDRQLPGRRAAVRAAHPLRAGQDDRRPARAALRRLRADRRPLVEPVPRAAPAVRRARPALLPAARRFERRFPADRRRCARPSGLPCTATSRSAAGSSCAARSSSTRGAAADRGRRTELG